MKKGRLLLFLILLLFLTYSLLVIPKENISSLPNTEKSSAPINLTIYTTTYPLFDFTKRIGGDLIKVVNILPPGAEVHSFEPSTRLVVELSKATLLIYNGGGLETFISKLQQTLQGTSVKLVAASKGIPLIKAGPSADNLDYLIPQLEAHTDDTEHGQYDPHIWLSPSNAIQMSNNILEALIDRDPVHQDYYEKRYLDLRNDLNALDQQYKTLMEYSENKTIIVSHAAFAYLCRDYGLLQMPVMGLNADAEPTPGRMKSIIEEIRKKKIDYIYVESLETTKIADTIARETGVNILTLNPLVSLTESELQRGKDYISVMKENLEALQRGLGQQP